MYDDCEATAQRKGILPFLFAFGEGKYFFFTFIYYVRTECDEERPLDGSFCSG